MIVPRSGKSLFAHATLINFPNFFMLDEIIYHPRMVLGKVVLGEKILCQLATAFFKSSILNLSSISVFIILMMATSASFLCSKEYGRKMADNHKA